MISFAGKVKSELCRVGISRQCCARAEGYGILLYCNTFTPTLVRIITENAEFAARLPRLFQRAFSVKFDRLPEDDGGHGKLVFQITDPEKLDRIINQLGYDPRQTMVLHVNFALLEDECCRTAFLRGAFLAGGSAWESLPEKLRQTAQLRLAYPELSLAQLAERCDPPVTKSCMNHRMRKLLEKAREQK